MAKKINRSLTLQIRLTPTEKLLIEEYASASHMDVSSFLRFLGLQGLRAQAQTQEIYKAKSVRIEAVEDEGHLRRHAG